MGTLKFTDKRAETKGTYFNEVPIGTTFEYENGLYIKITDNSAFDAINLTGRFFEMWVQIIEREAEIIFN